jgi:hypothetical protein
MATRLRCAAARATGGAGYRRWWTAAAPVHGSVGYWHGWAAARSGRPLLPDNDESLPLRYPILISSVIPSGCL